MMTHNEEVHAFLVDLLALYRGHGLEIGGEAVGWRSVVGRHSVGGLQAGVFSARPSVVTSVSAPVPRRAAGLHRAGELAFYGDVERLAQADAFTAWLAPFRKSEWVVYATPPFGGPEAVLAYLSRYNAPDICYLRFLDAGAQVGCQPIPLKNSPCLKG